MHHDYWATPTYAAPIVPPGHIDSQCPIWLSPHTYKPLHYGLAHSTKQHVTLDEWARIIGQGKELVAVLIKKAGIVKVNDEEYPLVELEAKVLPLFPPKDYVSAGFIRTTIQYGRCTWAQTMISKWPPDWSIHQYKFFSPATVTLIEAAIKEKKSGE